ncbi:MAG: alpha/beta hydrolase family protein [Winogradskyella sp.]|uniref:alpha/beta hydrolase family protein n=1 Tax=Winogradskyella sp. TaxID=1883156 RepID=UPI00385ED39F
MKGNILKLVLVLITLLLGVILGIYLRHNDSIWTSISTPVLNSHQSLFKTNKRKWGDQFKIVNIKSSQDSTYQKSYIYNSKSEESQPLIVSLHTWSGDFSQYDPIAQLCLKNDLNYIHPNFRGPNNTISACASDLVIADIDDSISYAKSHFNVDNSNIYVIGFSGGGYATLSSFMKSKHKIKAYSAWASISDLVAWYKQSNLRGENYKEDILACTGSLDKLNVERAKERSPIYWDTPIEKLDNQKLYIYAGIYDGIQGSVPITQSINFYNKILSDLAVKDASKYVSDLEKMKLLEQREALGNFGHINNRAICLKKEQNNVRLTVFKGNHEILTEFAFNDLLEKNDIN